MNFPKVKIKRFALLSALIASIGLSACNDDTPKPDNQTPAVGDSSTQAPSAPPVNTNAQNAEVINALQSNLNKAGVNLTVQSATATEMADWYWVTFDNAPPMLTNAKGDYLTQGQMVKLGGDKPINIEETVARNLLEQVSKDELIIFPATSDTKAAIYVFSDPSCHYCQKLHGEIQELNAKGIEVRYLAWPRSEQYIPVTKAIWCSADRQQAITDAKQGKNISADTCGDPVLHHMALGHQLGVSGTPSIFTESGLNIGGYIPADELAKLAISNKNP